MVLSDPEGKPLENHSSGVSPNRSKMGQRPRKDWLVAVGQGRSPASTRSGAETAAIRKKVDLPKLSFSGLEQDRKSLKPRSPASSSPRQLKKPKSPLPLSSPTAVTTTQPLTRSILPTRSPLKCSARPGQAMKAGSTPRGRETPKKDDTSSRVSGSPDGGIFTIRGSPGMDQQTVGGAEGVDGAGTCHVTDAADSGAPANGVGDAGSKHLALGSLTLASPGKEYWAGRIATSPRSSESPRARTPKTKAKLETQGLNPTGNTPWRSLGSRRAQLHHPGARASNFPGSRDPQVFTWRQTPSPLHSSAWSTQASLLSPSSGSPLSPSPGGEGRFGPRPWKTTPGTLTRTSSGLAPSGQGLSPMERFRQSAPTSGIQGVPPLSPTSLSAFGRAAPRSLSPARGAYSRTSRGRGNRSASPKKKQIPRGEISLHASPTLGRSRTRLLQTISPSSLPSASEDVVHEGELSPERTTSWSKCPEMPGYSVSLDRWDEFIENAAVADGDGSTTDVKEECGAIMVDARETGADEPLSRKAGPRIRFGKRRDAFEDGLHQGSGESGRRSSEACAAAAEQRSALRDGGVPVKLHLPPGVRAKLGTRSSSASSREASSGSSTGRSEPKLRVCTPKGDGSAADLSLWITLRDLEENKEATRVLSWSPTVVPSPRAFGGTGVENCPGNDSTQASVGDGFGSVDDASSQSKGGEIFSPDPPRGGAVILEPDSAPVMVVGTAENDHTSAEESQPLLQGRSPRTAEVRDDLSTGRRESVACPEVRRTFDDVGHIWSAFVTTLFGLLDFCRPTDRGDAVAED